MSTIICPHCNTSTRSGAFCEFCGKATSAGQGGPQIVEGAGLAQTGVGARLQSEQLEKKARSAAGALLAVAILSLIGLGLLWFLFKQAGRNVNWDIATPVMIAQAMLSFVFFALWLWARKSPLPAAIVGLVIYGSIILVSGMLDPTTIAQGAIVKVIIVVVLIKAISAGLQHRKLLQEYEGKKQ